LNLSPIPFEGVVAGVRVGYIDGEYVIFPTVEQLDKSMLDIVVAGTKNAVTMVEGEAKEVSEEIMLGALNAAHAAIKELVGFQEEILSEFKIDKWEIQIPQPIEGFIENFSEMINDEEIARIMLSTPGKKAKDKALKEYRNERIELKNGLMKKWN